MTLSPEHIVVIEEAASVFEAAAKHNRSKGRTVMSHSQQERADRLKDLLEAVKPIAQAGDTTIYER